eukprot:TRINITY_DN6542_c0_g1_i1.p1 TRINITY_DN6542_c0_g1~~TRINITY_DN6542_c0_g1_i1.p1  ORF type:complete len:379 (-),score=100.51 TRINITY_DN6542_c0_g1_i1:455-1591(-)
MRRTDKYCILIHSLICHFFQFLYFNSSLTFVIQQYLNLAMKSVILLSLLAFAAGQSSLSLAAQGGVGRNTAASALQAVGQDTNGDIVISADDTTVSSSAVVTATGTTPVSTPTPTPTPTFTPTPASTPATATATATSQATATGTGVASASATATTMPATMTTVLPVAVTTPTPAPKVYYKKMEQVKPQPTCADIKDDMCPAMSEFVNCGYCIVEKYPLVGYGCPIEKTLVKKQGKKGEYEVVTKAVCKCPEGAVIIEDPVYCPTCDLALTELAVCSGYDKIPKDISAIEITASCIEKVKVPMKFLEECKFIKSAPKDKKDPKKYIVEEPKKVSPPVIVVDPVVKGVKPVPVVPVSSATASASAVGSGTASAIASANAN